MYAPLMGYRTALLLALCVVQTGCTTEVSRTPALICQERGFEAGTEAYGFCVMREADRMAFGRYAAELELQRLRTNPTPVVPRPRPR